MHPNPSVSHLDQITLNLLIKNLWLLFSGLFWGNSQRTITLSNGWMGVSGNTARRFDEPQTPTNTGNVTSSHWYFCSLIFITFVSQIDLTLESMFAPLVGILFFSLYVRTLREATVAHTDADSLIILARYFVRLAVIQ